MIQWNVQSSSPMASASPNINLAVDQVTLSLYLNSKDSTMNKELVLREFLAIERTKLANETTFLAYIRTGLYFLVAGSTLGYVVQTPFWKIAGTPLLILGVVIMIIGVIRYWRVKRSIELAKRNVGNSTEAFIKLVRGDYSE